ncbi:MAG TPA: maltotransferase domain-containing protein, partial [Solirubrobacteraceae bacterium]|nr:maltotransferase domain-containing protein [Solirubrobacteraceae bacterium]
MPAPKTAEAPSRIRINYPTPTVDGGRYPAKRCVGDTVTVSADNFRDGHEILRAVVRYKAPGARRWVE